MQVLYKPGGRLVVHVISFNWLGAAFAGQTVIQYGHSLTNFKAIMVIEPNFTNQTLRNKSSYPQPLKCEVSYQITLPTLNARILGAVSI